MTSLNTTQGIPRQRSFPDTGHIVRGPFLEFVERFGLSLMGHPISDEVIENGHPVQYFENLALVEVEPGRVEPRPLGREVLELRRWLDELQTSAEQSESIIDLTGELPRNPEKQYEPRRLERVRHVVIHHTATLDTATPWVIADQHVFRFHWPGPAYHFMIDAAGTIYQTNELTVRAYHAGQFNATSVGVALIGDFRDNTPPEEQLAAAATLCARLLKDLGLPVVSIQGHQELLPTPCPGERWLGQAGWKARLQALVHSAQRMANGLAGLKMESARRSASETVCQKDGGA